MRRPKWPLVKRSRLLAERRRIRRQLIDHLRDNQRGLVLVDNVTIRDSKLPYVSILGDYNSMSSNWIGPEPNG